MVNLRPRSYLKWLKANYFIAIFFLAIVFVGIIVFLKLFFTPSTYVYAKIKMGQGLWWAGGMKPNIWFISALKKGDKATDFLGKPIAELVGIRYYPINETNNYDVYLTLRLKVAEDKKRGQYTFNRTQLTVGSPLEIQFTSAYVSGTVIGLDKNSFHDKYIEKTVSLVNKNGYTTDFPYRYEEIRIGDKYFDGEEDVFEVLEKSLENSVITVPNNLNGQIYTQQSEATKNIIIKAKIKVKEESGSLVYGEEYKVLVNKTLPLSTSNSFLEGFVVRGID